jgi:hypothetical protein
MLAAGDTKSGLRGSAARLSASVPKSLPGLSRIRSGPALVRMECGRFVFAAFHTSFITGLKPK